MALVQQPATFSPQLTRLPLTRNEYLPSRWDLLWLVEWGIIRTFTWTEQGTMIILGYWGAGDVIGQPLCGISPYRIECLTSAEVTAIPRNQWSQFLDGIIAHSQQTAELFSIIRDEPLYNRMEQLWRWLSKKFGRNVSDGILIDLPLTHQQIAELIGTTRVTVTKLLKQLEQERKLIRREKRYIMLTQQSELIS